MFAHRKTVCGSFFVAVWGIGEGCLSLVGLVGEVCCGLLVGGGGEKDDNDLVFFDIGGEKLFNG